MRLQIDSAMTSEGGAFGVSLKKLQQVRKDLAPVQEEYLTAVEAGLISFTQDIEGKREQAKRWQEEFSSIDEVWLFGEPSVLSSLQLVSERGPLAAKLRWVSSADPQVFDSLQEERSRFALLLTAATWGLELIELLSSSFAKIVFCLGDGTERKVEEAPDNVTLWSEEGIADSRFALFSSLAFALTTDVDHSINRFSTEVKELQQKGMWENSSALLACVFKSIDTEDIPVQVLLVGARSGWLSWIRWAEMIWKGMGSVQQQNSGLQKQWQGLASGCIVGDELGINQLSVRSPSRLVCLFEEREPLISNVTEALLEVWDISNREVDRFLSFAEQQQYPVAIFQTQKLSGIELIQLSVRWVHSIMLLNALRGVNPLSMSGADQWRLFQAPK